MTFSFRSSFRLGAGERIGRTMEQRRKSRRRRRRRELSCGNNRTLFSLSRVCAGNEFGFAPFFGRATRVAKTHSHPSRATAHSAAQAGPFTFRPASQPAWALRRLAELETVSRMSRARRARPVGQRARLLPASANRNDRRRRRTGGDNNRLDSDKCD